MKLADKDNYPKERSALHTFISAKDKDGKPLCSLSASARLVLMTLFDIWTTTHDKEQNYRIKNPVPVSFTQLINDTQLAHDTIKKALKDMEAAGLITAHRSSLGGHQCQEYTLYSFIEKVEKLSLDDNETAGSNTDAKRKTTRKQKSTSSNEEWAKKNKPEMDAYLEGIAGTDFFETL